MLGIDNVSCLKDGLDNPPAEDQQVYLGLLKFEFANSYKLLLSTLSLSSPPPLATTTTGHSLLLSVTLKMALLLTSIDCN